MKILRLLLASLILTSLSACNINNTNNIHNNSNYTIIVSLDGFRADYQQWYNTPTFDSIAANGVQATMLPSFPASTFPNHYTLATGLVPDHHGIVNNSFWDTKRKVRYSLGDSATRHDISFYGGEPIWNTATKQGLNVGTVYWVGSDLHIQNMDPTYYMDWQDAPQIPFQARVDSVISWLSKPAPLRPRLIMSYFEEPDKSGHWYSPHGVETKLCVEYLDSLMGQLRSRLNDLPFADSINLIITSDHGMATISPDRCIRPSDHLKDHWFDVFQYGTPTSIFSKPQFRDSIFNALKDIPHLSVWKREDIPADLQYGSFTDRIGDIVVCPEVGWQFYDRPSRSVGAHGYRPSDKQMQVMFVAEGPDFKHNFKADNFPNVDIYTMLCHLLNINPEPTDGDMNRIINMFNP